MPINAEYWKILNDQWNAGLLLRPGIALTQLRANPRAFLRKYPLRNIFDCPHSGVMRAYLANSQAEQRPGTILRTLRMHDAQGFQIQMNPGQLGEGNPFWAHAIFTQPSNAPMVWYTLDGNGPDIMLTAKLTGCTFVAVAGPAAGTCNVIHMQPTGEDGMQLATRMNVAHGVAAYGRNRYNYADRSINVIGVRVNGSWKIYAQKIEKQHLTIRSVHRIFPPE